MAEKAETRFGRRVVADINALPNAFAVKIQQQATRGTPDVLAAVAGRAVTLELKEDGGQPTRLQSYILARFRRAGAIALVVKRSEWPGVLESLRELATSSPRAS